MPFIIHCPECKRKLRIQDHLNGKNIKCPGCGIKLLAKPTEPTAPAEVPALAPTEPAPAPSVAPTPLAAAIQEPAQIPADFGAQLPTVIKLPPLSSPSNEEPLEVLDPIVLEEPSTDDQGEETTTAPPPEADEPAPKPRPDVPAPSPSSPLRVFALLTGLLVLTVILGLVGGWWINRSVEHVRQKTHMSR